MSALKKRLRFTDVDDLLLLREVLSNNPFENPDVWSVIQQHIYLITGKLFSIRTLKEHLELLIKLWEEQVKILKDKSGIEIEYTEKHNLCESVYSLMNEFKKQKINKKMSIADKKLGIDARNKWSHQTSIHAVTPNKDVQRMSSQVESVAHDHFSLIQPIEIEESCIEIFDTDVENVAPHLESVPEDSAGNVENIVFKKDVTAALVTPSHTPQKRKILAPVKSRKRKISAQRQGLAYLATYDAAQIKSKEKELELEERKLALEEKKSILQEKQIEITNLENKRRYDLEEKKMELLISSVTQVAKIIERQEKIINLLLEKRNDV